MPRWWIGAQCGTQYCEEGGRWVVVVVMIVVAVMVVVVKVVTVVVVEVAKVIRLDSKSVPL